MFGKLYDKKEENGTMFYSPREGKDIKASKFLDQVCDDAFNNEYVAVFDFEVGRPEKKLVIRPGSDKINGEILTELGKKKAEANEYLEELFSDYYILTLSYFSVMKDYLKGLVMEEKKTQRSKIIGKIEMSV